uniref:Uncharacterized protein n=1 Tax=Strongyloides venezuelensis TaxID=75913 RepID=A0A0K0G2T1_STRVS
MSIIKVKEKYDSTTVSLYNNDKNMKSTENNSFESMNFKKMTTYNRKGTRKDEKFHDKRNGKALSLDLKVLLRSNIILQFRLITIWQDY